jgi:hypothetical protein
MTSCAAAVGSANSAGATAAVPGERIVKSAVFGLVLIGATLSAGAVYASSADDAKWIARCIMDNKDEKVSADVMTKYCTCMTNKMDENETKSVTQWEKTHKTEEAQCDKESGWTK